MKRRRGLRLAWPPRPPLRDRSVSVRFFLQPVVPPVAAGVSCRCRSGTQTVLAVGERPTGVCHWSCVRHEIWPSRRAPCVAASRRGTSSFLRLRQVAIDPSRRICSSSCVVTKIASPRSPRRPTSRVGSERPTGDVALRLSTIRCGELVVATAWSAVGPPTRPGFRLTSCPARARQRGQIERHRCGLRLGRNDNLSQTGATRRKQACRHRAKVDPSSTPAASRRAFVKRPASSRSRRVVPRNISATLPNFRFARTRHSTMRIERR